MCRLLPPAIAFAWCSRYCKTVFSVFYDTVVWWDVSVCVGGCGWVGVWVCVGWCACVGAHVCVCQRNTLDPRHLNPFSPPAPVPPPWNYGYKSGWTHRQVDSLTVSALARAGVPCPRACMRLADVRPQRFVVSKLQLRSVVCVKQLFSISIPEKEFPSTTPVYLPTFLHASLGSALICPRRTLLRSRQHGRH